MATQWDKTGYFYAISIAQFGLSHHAKFLLDDTPTSKVCVICRGHNHMNTPFAHSCLDISLRSLKLINTRQHNLMAQLQIYPLTVVCLFALLSFYNIQICCLIIWTNMYILRGKSRMQNHRKLHCTPFTVIKDHCTKESVLKLRFETNTRN